jgi:hypothetical protein
MIAAAVCIRCGSKEHSTRDHDEGRIPGGKAAAAPKKPPPKSAPPVGGDGQKKPAKLQHRDCWKKVPRNAGIPALFDPLRDKPIREKFVDKKHDIFVHQEHLNCPCATCEKKRAKAALDWARKQGKA